jgi:MFS family permease
MSAKPKTYYGWRVLIALFFVGALGPMGRFSLTAFFPSITLELGWSRSEIGSAQTLTLWVYSLVSILTGWMIDRIGGRKTILIGGLLTFIGWLLLSTIASLWQLYVYYGFVMAIAVSNTHLVPTQGTARKWFVKRAGLAGGILGSAYAVGTALIIPLLTLASSTFNWRTVSIVCAFAFSIPVLLLAYFVIRDTPESAGQYPDGVKPPPAPLMANTALNHRWKIKEALRTPQLWLLFIAYGLSGIVINGFMAHAVMFSVDLGSTAAAAGIIVTFFNGPSILARVGGGWLGDRYGKLGMMRWGIFLSCLVMLLGWWGIHTSNQLMFFAPIMGIGTSLAISLFGPYIGDLYGRQNVGFLFAILTAGWGLIGGLGPIIWGIISDNFGNYGYALLVSAACYALGLIALLLVRPLQPR